MKTNGNGCFSPGTENGRVQKVAGRRKLPGQKNRRLHEESAVFELVLVSVREKFLLKRKSFTTEVLLEDEGEKDAQGPFDENVKNKAEHIRASFLKSLNSA